MYLLSLSFWQPWDSRQGGDIRHPRPPFRGSGKSSGECTSTQKKDDRKSKRIRQKNKRGDSKVESNDSPEIPDLGETSDILGLPSGDAVISHSKSWTTTSSFLSGISSDLENGLGYYYWHEQLTQMRRHHHAVLKTLLTHLVSSWILTESKNNILVFCLYFLIKF